MRPGRELDAAIAVAFGGWKRFDQLPDFMKDQAIERYPNAKTAIYAPGAETDTKPYSTDIKAAWEIVTRLSSSRFFDILYSPERKTWQATFVLEHPLNPDNLGIGDTAPLAICLAALKVVETKQ